VFLSIHSARILCAGSIGKIEFTREMRHRRRRPPRWRTRMIYASASRDMELNIQSLGKRELAFHNPDLAYLSRHLATYARQRERERNVRHEYHIYSGQNVMIDSNLRRGILARFRKGVSLTMRDVREIKSRTRKLFRESVPSISTRSVIMKQKRRE
jgi:hypothetical protein